jgi:hypothetical protein
MKLHLFYIAQTYTTFPKHLIHVKHVKIVWISRVSVRTTDITFEKFQEICSVLEQ